MRHNTISEKHGTHHTIVAELSILAGVLMLVALGDALAVSALAVAFVLTAWWIYREIGHRVEARHAGKHAQVAQVAQVVTVTNLRPTVTAPAHISWHGPRAA